VAKIIDRFLLLVFSLVTGAAFVIMLLAAFAVIPLDRSYEFLQNVYHDMNTAVAFITAAIVLLLIAIRLFVISIRSSNANPPSIDQRSEYGDIRISLDTVENLALKAANRSRGVRDLKARVNISGAGLDIVIRCIVDGETSIPVMTEEIQSAVKDHVEDITGIPVASVSVFIANVAQSSHTFKSRVE
jgi:uncharacterized alkaline shock family protein YloU